eukprot:CAMPEP_0119383284 /NCGR_PEP_ID=MMETSP1334-20130426/78289_1 /TAXON_ID=127549 /ORGANISM="Calcidiscus leptoporus, Strain RCC1130" /LENGTH=211 /DNA_ID=CAMNT_0007404045 /DNA_START=75 /DNA_END=710 /DNA_ORIENTATION=-
MRYYELAKQTHPDVLNGEKASAAAPARAAPVVKDASRGMLDEPEGPASAVQFLELHAAFEAIMEDLEAGGTSSAERSKKTRGSARRKTLGEVLCERLHDEPEAVHEVWGELKGSSLEVSGQMLNQLFKACSAIGPAGVVLALTVLNEGSSAGIVSQGVRSSGLASLLGLCGQRDDWDVDLVIDEISDEDRESPEVLAALGAVFCAGTRSLY